VSVASASASVCLINTFAQVFLGLSKGGPAFSLNRDEIQGHAWAHHGPFSPEPCFTFVHQQPRGTNATDGATSVASVASPTPAFAPFQKAVACFLIGSTDPMYGDHWQLLVITAAVQWHCALGLGKTEWHFLTLDFIIMYVTFIFTGI